MTENELRQKVCNIINAWIGGTMGSAIHKEILNIYNNHTPLAVGYKVKDNDAYCATTVSAAWIKAGIAAYTGTECGVGRFIRLAQDKGIWEENDAYVPKLGDAVVYDWQDGTNYATTDNRGAGDHIGIVTQTGSTSFVVTEGNMGGGRVGTRNLAVNGRYIRGFIVPNYAAIVKALGGEEIVTDTTPDKTSKSVEEIAKEVVAGLWGNGTDRKSRLIAAGYAYTAVQSKVNELLKSSTTTAQAPAAQASSTTQKTLYAEKYDKTLAGGYTVKASNGLNVRTGPSTEYDVITTLKNGAKVRNYGYYSIRGGVKWLFIRAGETVGFVSSAYLVKA